MKTGKKAGNMEKMPKKWKKGSTAKAVMFIPYTNGSLLAKKLREQETDMEKLTGYRLKVVERAGTKVENILPITNPWAGNDCLRKNCLPCETKSKAGKESTKSCRDP